MNPGDRPGQGRWPGHKTRPGPGGARDRHVRRIHPAEIVQQNSEGHFYDLEARSQPDNAEKSGDAEAHAPERREAPRALGAMPLRAWVAAMSVTEQDARWGREQATIREGHEKQQAAWRQEAIDRMERALMAKRALRPRPTTVPSAPSPATSGPG